MRHKACVIATSYLACLILTNDSEACWNVISAKPKGITNQVYFRSAKSLGNTSQIYQKGEQLYAHYAEGDVAISNACIAGQGTSTTVKGLQSLCSDGADKYNVFFYHDN